MENVMTPKKIYELAKKEYSLKEISYDIPEKNTFGFSFSICDGVNGDLYIVARENISRIYCDFPIIIPPEKISEVLEYIFRINHNEKEVRFEYDYESQVVSARYDFNNRDVLYLPEYKVEDFCKRYCYGLLLILEKDVKATDAAEMAMAGDWIIENGILKKYNGNEEIVYIPEEAEIIDCEAFAGCENIAVIHMNGGVKEIREGAFSDCVNLEKIIIPETVSGIGSRVFKNCKKLEKIILKGNSSFELENGVLYTKFKECILHYPYEKKDERFVVPGSVRYIKSEAFYGNKYIKEVFIPENTSINPHAFSGCSNLERIYFAGQENLISPTAFSKCNNLIIFGKKGSDAEKFSRDNNIRFEYVKELPEEVCALFKDREDRREGGEFFCSVFTNSLEEAAAGFAKNIIVTACKDGSLSVSDDGQGIFLDYNSEKEMYNWEIIFDEKLSKYEYTVNNSNYNIKYCGGGSLFQLKENSEYFNIISVRDGYKYELNFRNGKIEGGLKKKEIKRKKTGTTVKWKPLSHKRADREYIKEIIKTRETYLTGHKLSFTKGCTSFVPMRMLDELTVTFNYEKEDGSFVTRITGD